MLISMVGFSWIILALSIILTVFILIHLLYQLRLAGKEVFFCYLIDKPGKAVYITFLVFTLLVPAGIFGFDLIRNGHFSCDAGYISSVELHRDTSSDSDDTNHSKENPLYSYTIRDMSYSAEFTFAGMFVFIDIILLIPFFYYFFKNKKI